MPDTKHTPLPWRLGTDGNVWSGETHGEQLAIVHHLGGEESVKPDNGRLIVLAVNSHEKLLAEKTVLIDVWLNCRWHKAGCVCVRCEVIDAILKSGG